MLLCAISNQKYSPRADTAHKSFSFSAGVASYGFLNGNISWTPTKVLGWGREWFALFFSIFPEKDLVQSYLSELGFLVIMARQVFVIRSLESN